MNLGLGYNTSHDRFRIPIEPYGREITLRFYVESDDESRYIHKDLHVTITLPRPVEIITSDPEQYEETNERGGRKRIFYIFDETTPYTDGDKEEVTLVLGANDEFPEDSDIRVEGNIGDDLHVERNIPCEHE